MKISIVALVLLGNNASFSAAAAVDSNPQDCINASEYDADTDFFPDKFVPHNTTDLITVEYFNTYKIYTNHFQDKSYVFYQCGTEPPAEEIDSGKHHLILPVPHKGKVAFTQTPQIAPMELLGLRREIDAVIGDPKFISSPCLNHMRGEGEMVDVYDQNSTVSAQMKVQYMEENPDVVVFAGPYGDKDDERHIAIAASQERTAVATFDWLGMYAALYNLEKPANKIIRDTESRFDCSAQNAAVLTADQPKDEKPSILWANYFSSIPGWSVAECPTPDAAYYCEYAHHCGANILARPDGVGFNRTYGGPTVFWYLTDEEFLEFGKDAETFIFANSVFSSVYEEKKGILDQFKSVQNKNVYDTQGQGEFAWHEQRLAEYDVVALDMCELVGTLNPDSFHVRRWFRSYFSEPIGGLGSCDAEGGEVELAYVPEQAQCSPILLEKVAEDVSEEISEEVVEDASEEISEEVSEEDSQPSSAATLYISAASLFGAVTMFL